MTAGAERFGVVLTEEGAVDDGGTLGLRTRLRDGRGELPVFDRGPELDVILARCQEETGLPAPTRPVWT